MCIMSLIVYFSPLCVLIYFKDNILLLDIKFQYIIVINLENLVCHEIDMPKISTNKKWNFVLGKSGGSLHCVVN